MGASRGASAGSARLIFGMGSWGGARGWDGANSWGFERLLTTGVSWLLMVRLRSIWGEIGLSIAPGLLPDCDVLLRSKSVQRPARVHCTSEM